MDEDWEYEDIEPIGYMPARFQPGEQHWGFGLGTKVEGVLGQKLRKVYKLIATEEEKFKDNMIKISLDLGIKSEELTTLVEEIIPLVPDLKYKSPIALLLGFIAYKNKLLQNVNKFKKFLEDNEDKMRYKYYRITKLDVVRYAHLINRIINKEEEKEEEYDENEDEEKEDIDDNESESEESDEYSNQEVEFELHDIDMDDDASY